jgi:hypothetical protein
MLRKTMVALVVALGLGSFGLSTGALARGGDHVAGGFGDHRGGGVSGVHRGTHGYGRPDVWGRWGAYYGPMIPPI